MKNHIFNIMTILFLAVVYRPHAQAYAENPMCSSMSIAEFNPSTGSGNLVLNPLPDDPYDDIEPGPFPEHLAVIAAPISIVDEQISPDGQYLAGTHGERGIYTTIVYNSDFQIIYEGTSRSRWGTSHWFGNETVMTLVTRHGNIYSTVGIYFIEPFTQEYRYIEPDRQAPLYWTDGTGTTLDRAMFSYDGRYYWPAGSSGITYDFLTNSAITSTNIPGGLMIPSISSNRLLQTDYSTYRYNGGEPAESPASVSVYDFATDTLTQVASLTIDSPIDIYGAKNSWSPDERKWALALDYGDEILFQRILLLDIASGLYTPLCVGRYYYIGDAPTFDTQGNIIPNSFVPFVQGVDNPDFAWSRDSRYLALQGVIEGEDMDESLGVYIYDTQTGDVYEVYRGRADIIGWMAAE